jgi:ABC-2 type transport system permease protein
MNSTLFRFTLKSGLGSIIAWSLADYIDEMGSLVEVFAGEVGSILNPDGTLSLGKYLALEFFSMWPLLMAVYAIFNAGGIAAREVERGTMDMLLSQPLYRWHLIVSKFLVFPLTLIIIAVTCTIGILLGMVIISDFSDLDGICLAFLPAILLALAVASYTLLFSCIFLEPRKVMLVAGSVTGLFYVLHILSRAIGSLGWMGNLSIFYYYEPAKIASDQSMNWAGIVIYLSIIALCFAASIHVFQRRDISA